MIGVKVPTKATHRKVPCPFCGAKIAITGENILWKHVDKAAKEPCAGSSWRFLP